ncbi:MAG: DUF3606 domain-containing protein [Caulobacterales bacterium]|jgi:hypothetical protein
MADRVAEPRHWRPAETIDVTNDADVREWATRLCVTPNELREMVEELGDRTARVATEVGIPVRNLGSQDAGARQ